MSDTPTRRAVLALVAGTAGSGCLGYFDNGPQCRLGPDPPQDRSEAVEAYRFSVTSNNQRRGGSCSRATATVCLEATVKLDPKRIDRLVGQTGGGERLAATTVEEETVILELAELDQDDHGEYEVLVLRGDEVVERASVAVDCRPE